MHPLAPPPNPGSQPRAGKCTRRTRRAKTATGRSRTAAGVGPLRAGTASRPRASTSSRTRPPPPGGAHPGFRRARRHWGRGFRLAGKPTVWVHMDATIVLNNNGEAVFDVDVSVDNGASWENVFRGVAPAPKEREPSPLADIPEELEGGPQVGNADAFYGPLDLDI